MKNKKNKMRRRKNKMKKRKMRKRKKKLIQNTKIVSSIKIKNMKKNSEKLILRMPTI